MSNNMKIIVPAIIVCLLGAGVAVWQKGRTAAPVATEVATAAVPAAETPTAEPGQIVPNAPDMPQSAASAPGTAPSENTAMAPQENVGGLQAGGPFSLVDQKGNPVTEKSWPGKYKLVFFGFTRCTDVCPATLQKISTLMENYDPRAEKLQPLFITTDAAHDTKDIMATYIGGYNPNILGLTGTSDELRKAADEYKVYAVENEDGTPDHSAYIYLMSPDDRALEIMSPTLSADDMIAKIRMHVDTVAPAAPAPDTVAGSAPATSTAPAATP